MTRSGLAFGGLLVVGGLLWLVVVWPTPHDSGPSQAPIVRGEAGHASTPGPAVGVRPGDKGPAPAAAVSVSPPESEPDKPHPTALPPPTAELFAEPHGPVDEYKQRFESEPRDSAAHDAEQTIRAAFEPEAKSGLLRSVLCRQTICRLELRWSPPVLGDYVAAMTRMSMNFDRKFAVAPLGPSDADHTRSVELYLKRGASPGISLHEPNH